MADRPVSMGLTAGLPLPDRHPWVDTLSTGSHQTEEVGVGGWMMAVTFTPKGRLYYLDPGDLRPAVGSGVLFPTSLGPEVATVAWPAMWVDDDIAELPVCAGLAHPADVARDAENRRRRAQIRVAAQRLIREAQLPMKVAAVDWADRNHASGRATATVFFTSPSRIDFRQLVSDLARTLDCKVMLTQLGPRDDARAQGGIGPCGRETCCSTFLHDFEPVTLRMAKDQDLPVNPMRVSGACGRLMCCLAYEHAQYLDFAAQAPAPGSAVDTDEGPGVVVGHDVPRDGVVVRLDETGHRTVCPRASVCVPRREHEERHRGRERRIRRGPATEPTGDDLGDHA